MNKNEKLRLAAKEFVEKATTLATLREVAIVGSVAGNDLYPNDIDIAVIVTNLDELPIMAKYARQMSRIYHNWEVFMFNEEMAYLGRICYRKKCPAMAMDCQSPGCGDPPHLMIKRNFDYDERVFFASPIDVLWISYEESCFIEHKKKLGLTESRKYKVLEDISLKCFDCGKRFIFGPEEQKHFEKLSFHPPKRCSACRERKQRENLF